MNGYRQCVVACRWGAAVVAVLAAGSLISRVRALPSSERSLSVKPSLGAHTLLTQSEGMGSAPAVTRPIDTAAGHSALIVFNGGYSSNASTPVDRYSNRWKPLGQAVPYGNGYGDRFDVTGYVALFAKGGPGQTVRFAKRADPAGEISVPFVEIRHAGAIEDVAQNYAPAGLVLKSGNVTTTGPAALVALWWGDGGIKRMLARPNNGFVIVDSFLQLPDNSGVQCAVAFKQVAAAGTYNVSWTGVPVQGAILWLLAFRPG